MSDRQRIETTYADLRSTDLVIDKTGKAWPIADVEFTTEGQHVAVADFWLCDFVTKVKQHFMSKPGEDPVTVSRVPTRTDEATNLEAEFPITVPLSAFESQAPAAEAEFIAAVETGSFVTMEEAVAAVEEIGGTVEAEVTAEEVDAAHAATEDAPVHLPAFESMTPLEQRSHLYLLHGVYAADLKSRDELSSMHYETYRQRADGKLQSQHVPHVHEEA